MKIIKSGKNLSMIFSIIAIFALILCSSVFAGELSIAPINPEYLEYITASNQGVKSISESGYPLGEIPTVRDYSYLKNIKTKEYFTKKLDASYDLRTASPARLTAVKNQSTCGSCWTFATMGSLESCQQTSDYNTPEPNYSENNLKNTAGFDYGHCAGGNIDMSGAYLARWDGPISEADDPYSPSSSISPTGLTVRKHVQDIIYLPGKASDLDNDAIKNAVVTYGAVYVSMRWSDTYFNATNNAYYTNATLGTDTGHAICIIGWDDNFDKNKFTDVPAGNGAFLVRNSWGTSWGSSGYFYCSYYDKYFGRSALGVFVNPESTTNYTKIYQYDPLGWWSGLGYSDTTASFANKFTATSSDSLKAIAWFSASPNSTYEYWVYTGVTGDPNTGTQAAHKTGTITYAGYHTLKLDSAVSLSNGTVFSVVVRLTTPGYNYPIPIELGDPAYYTSGATASAGQSYISYSGSSWSDLTSNSGYEKTNVSLKAFAGDTTSIPTWELY